jgi:DNA-binding response OmpR family regulator
MSAGKVLLIEDDAKIAAIIRRGLELKDIDVAVTEDGPGGRKAWAWGDSTWCSST